MFAAKIRGNKRKAGAALALVLLCVILGAGWLAAGREKRDERFTAAVLFADSVADKFQNEEGYYLTVVLDDSLIEHYHLSYDRISFKTSQNIYNQVSPGEPVAGVTLEIRGPGQPSAPDLGAVLKGKRNDLCEIVSLTTAGNTVIDGQES